MNRECKTILLSGALVLGLLAPAERAEAGAADRLVPHKALYELSLKGAPGNTDVVGVGGKMSFEWGDACDGWTINQRNLMILQSAEGSRRSVDSVMTTWEAKDGSSFRFIADKDFGGGGTEKIKGLATRAGDGAITAAFSEPGEVSMDMASDVLFPSAHTFRLLDEIEGGAKFFSAPLFDGSEFEPASFVSAAVGRQKIDETSEDPLLSGIYWPLRLAFYGPGNREEVPDYELVVELHPNGIARRLEIHFKEFSVDVTLIRLERLETSGC